MAPMINKKIVAIIPARGGSKGLPGKNTADLAGKPLIAWTIEASLASDYIAKTLVTSEDDGILAVSAAHGADTIKRPAEFATDTATSESVIRDALEQLARTREKFEYLILLQPTSPLRTRDMIDAACARFFDSGATALISVCEIDNKILKAFKADDDGYIRGISNDRYPFMRRQDLPETYISNGAIYIINIDEFRALDSLLTDKTIPFVMDGRSSMDIDTAEDLAQVAQMIAAERH
tara:strand:- start:671 stop:1378 length:708 start_codon:yes stop_codon:yes gene_type:complete